MTEEKITKVTTNKKATKTTPIVKEDKTMNKKETVKKAVATKEVKAIETKKEVVNTEKVNKFISIQEVTEMYKSAGIECKNPNVKGNYRIMKGGSSLNLKGTKGYFIYTTDEDFALIQESGIKGEDLKVEKGTNSQDHQRPNTVICTTVATLKALLAVYAKNEANKVTAITK